MMRFLIAAVLFLSCGECLAQAAIHHARHNDHTNHAFWLNRRIEFDVMNGAVNSRKETYHVVIETGAQYTWKIDPRLQKKPWLRKPNRRLIEVRLPAQITISPPRLGIPSISKFSAVSQDITSETAGFSHLFCRFKTFPFGKISFRYQISFDGKLYVSFSLNYHPPSGKTNLKDNIDIKQGFYTQVDWLD